MSQPKTIVVEGPHGQVRIQRPDAHVKPIIVRAGKTVRGTTYFHASLMLISSEFADHLVASGDADLARIIRK